MFNLLSEACFQYLKAYYFTVAVEVEHVYLTALIWPTDNGGITIRETAQIRLAGLAYYGPVLGLPSPYLMDTLIKNGITSTSKKLSCSRED